jgi:hypothetical protein
VETRAADSEAHAERRRKKKRRKIKSKVFFKIGISVILILFLLEAGMRTWGRGILAEQEKNNEIFPADSHSIRIVTIGESTTADYFSEGNLSAWPRQLENKLKEKGVNVRVYNLGRPATTTTKILESLPEQLDRFQPHVVISMMGITEKNNIFVQDFSWWEQLRIFKLYRWIQLHFKKNAEVFLPENFDDPRTTQEIYQGLKSNPLQTIARAKERAENLDPTQRAKYYFYLGDLLYNLEGNSKHDNSIELYRLSLAAKFQGGQLLNRFADELSKTDKDEECFQMAEVYADYDWLADEYLLRRFSKCAMVSSRMHPSLMSRWREVLEEVNGGGNVDESLDAQKRTTKNYRTLFRLLRERNIGLIAMQYPTLSLEELKNYFKDQSDKIAPEFQDILFVENKINFDDAIKRKGYDGIFIDTYGESFGHTTGIGHSLIADTAATALREYIRNCTKCGFAK